MAADAEGVDSLDWALPGMGRVWLRYICPVHCEMEGGHLYYECQRCERSMLAGSKTPLCHVCGVDAGGLPT